MDQYATSDVCNPLGDKIHWGTIDNSLRITMVIKMEGFYYLLLSHHSKRKSEIYKFRHRAPDVMLKCFPVMHTVLILSIFMWYIFCKYDKLTSWLLHAKPRFGFQMYQEGCLTIKQLLFNLSTFDRLFLSSKGLGIWSHCFGPSVWWQH